MRASSALSLTAEIPTCAEPRNIFPPSAKSSPTPTSTLTPRVCFPSPAPHHLSVSLRDEGFSAQHHESTVATRHQSLKSLQAIPSTGSLFRSQTTPMPRGESARLRQYLTVFYFRSLDAFHAVVLTISGLLLCRLHAMLARPDRLRYSDTRSKAGLKTCDLFLSSSRPRPRNLFPREGSLRAITIPFSCHVMSDLHVLELCVVFSSMHLSTGLK